jgi:hypothetical protein
MNLKSGAASAFASLAFGSLGFYWIDQGGVDPGSRLYFTRPGWRDDARRRRAKTLSKRRRRNRP